VGGFLYTNRDSLSLGYVLPLDNLKKNYHGDHDRLFEWFKGLPAISDLAKDATLSAYGTKIIRSGGWREQPVLVEDGMAVGGASAGLGIDIPFPNFTGPAAATGLYFARAVKGLLKDGHDLDAKNLSRAYLAPLRTALRRNALPVTLADTSEGRVSSSAGPRTCFAGQPISFRAAISSRPAASSGATCSPSVRSGNPSRTRSPR
jgi:flavin-dependent dehydrogenase